MNKILWTAKTALCTLAAIVTMAGASSAQAQQAGNAADGQKKAAMCIGCHGIPNYRASFPEVYQVPMISGQSEDYIIAALTSYKKGDRRHPTMRGIAGSLTDQDMADLAAFYASHKPAQPAAQAPAPSTAVAELLKKGNCASCHGDGLNKPISPAYPKLAGQHGDYIFAALKSYQTQGSVMGRNNAIMGAQVKPFSHAELKQLADYIGSVSGDLSTHSNSKMR